MRKKTHEEFCNEVFNLVGEEYSVLSEYVNSQTKLKIKHNNINCDKYEYLVRPHDFIMGSRCPKCNGGVRNKNTDYFKKEVYDLVGGEYIVLGEYLGARDNILIEHIDCHNTFFMTPDNFLRGQRCPKCMRIKSGMERRKDHDLFVKNVYSIIGDDIKNFQFKDEYKLAIEPIKIKCLIDGYEWYISPNQFISNGCTCPKCRNFIKDRDTNLFKQEVFNLVEEEYSVLGEYIDTQTKIIMRHNECGKEYLVTPNNFIHNKRRCPECFGSKLKTHEIFKQEIYKEVGNEYLVLTEYQTAIKKIKIKHMVCEKEYYVTPHGFLRGSRCPYCNESKGEKVINNYLNKYNINFITQCRIKECKDKRTLPFDFAIFNDKENKKLKCLIEYDGEFHYKIMKGYSTKESLKTQKNRDNIKDEYCKKNDIKLIRIPYWEFDNIEAILEKELNLQGGN